MPHFVDIADFTGDELRNILKTAVSLKADFKAGGNEQLLKGKTLAMIFEKNSTRTRVSFDLAMRQLGGYAMELDCQNSQLGRGESIADTARVLSRYVDIIMFRAREHFTLLEMASSASVPVINGLTSYSHPCQILADILTFEEHKGPIAGKTLTWVGDGNNVLISYIHAAILFGFNLNIACPTAYRPLDKVVDWAESQKASSSGRIQFFTDAVAAVKGTQAIVTDTWMSMGDEEKGDAQAKKAALKPYQVNEFLMNTAEDAIFMHCLPAHRGEEVTPGVIDGNRSVVFDEAENRLHVQKAVLLHCLGIQG
ncbi:ornithine carbamoyltransferase [bacterium]|nr:ornithine carbamoyltransferase [bacterium]